MSDVDISIRLVDREIQASLRRIERGFESMRASANRATASTATGFDRAASSVRKFESSIVLLTRSFQLLAGGAAFDIFRRFVDEVESANNALRTLAGTEEQFIALQNQAIAVANQTGATYRSTAASIARVYRSIEDMGGSAKDAVQIVATLNKTLMVSGATTSEAASTLTQFTQALQSGVLQGDELRSLRENAPLIFKAIAKSAGVATSELKKMGSEGKLTTELITKAVLDPKFATALDELRSRMNLTFTQQLQIATNNFAVFLEQLNRSSGVLNFIGQSLIKLSEAIQVLADYKATTAILALTAAILNYRNTVVIATLATRNLSAVWVLMAGSIQKAAAAVALFVRTNPVLFGLSVILAGVAFAYDKITAGAKKAEEQMRTFRDNAALETTGLDEFLSERQLATLIEAKAQLEANKVKVQEIRVEQEKLAQKAEAASKLQQSASFLLEQSYRTQSAEYDRVVQKIEDSNMALRETVVLMDQVIAAIKQSQAIGDAIKSADDVVAGLAKQLEQTRALKQTDQERIDAAKQLVKIEENKALNALRTKDALARTAEVQRLINQEGLSREQAEQKQRQQFVAAQELIRLSFQKTADDAEIYVKAVIDAEKANENFGKSVKEKKGKDNTSLFKDYAESVEQARIALANLQKQIEAVRSGASDKQLAALQRQAELEQRIAEIRARYAETPDKGQALIDAAIKEAALNQELDDGNELRSKQLDLEKKILNANNEVFIQTEKLRALQNGASAEEIAALEKKLRLTLEYKGVSVDAAAAAEEAADKSVKKFETAEEKLAKMRAAAAEWGGKIGTALGEVAVGAKKATDAVKELLLEVIKLIVKLLVIKALEVFGRSSSISGGIGSIMPQSGVLSFSSGPAINVYNYGSAPGGVQATRNSDGSINLIIGQITNAIQRGGNPLDQTLRRTYGLGRVGN